MNEHETTIKLAEIKAKCIIKTVAWISVGVATSVTAIMSPSMIPVYIGMVGFITAGLITARW